MHAGGTRTAMTRRLAEQHGGKPMNTHQMNVETTEACMRARENDHGAKQSRVGEDHLTGVKVLARTCS